MNFESIAAALRSTINKLARPHVTSELESELQRFIAPNWVPGVRMLVGVSMYGCNFCVLGIHPKLNEYAEAIIGQAKSERAHILYLVSERGVRELSVVQAREAANKLDYRTTDDAVYRNDGTLLAQFTLTPEYVKHQQRGTVAFESKTMPILAERMALAKIADCMVINYWNTFFCKPSAVLLNGSPLDWSIQEPVDELEIA